MNTILKPANVVMLATDKSLLHEVNGSLVYNELHSTAYGCSKPQHLYFTTDEEIEKGDWVYSVLYGIGIIEKDYGGKNPDRPLIAKFLNSEVRQSYHRNGKYDIYSKQSEVLANNCRKIITTTNPELWSASKRYPFISTIFDGVAKIPTSFIETYVKAQGKIDKVMLEYEKKPLKITDCELCNGSGIYHEGDNMMISKCKSCYSTLTLKQREDVLYRNTSLKLRPDNTVIVHEVKKRMYSRAEVEHILCDMGYEIAVNKKVFMDSIDVKKWLNENYTQ